MDSRYVPPIMNFDELIAIYTLNPEAFEDIESDNEGRQTSSDDCVMEAPAAAAMCVPPTPAVDAAVETPESKGIDLSKVEPTAEVPVEQQPTTKNEDKSSQRRSYNKVDHATKLAIIREFDSGRVKVCDLARKYKAPHSTLASILSNRDRILGTGSSNKRKELRKTIDVATKVAIFKEFDSKILKHSEIAKKFGISKSTLSTILANRHKIECNRAVQCDYLEKLDLCPIVKGAEAQPDSPTDSPSENNSAEAACRQDPLIPSKDDSEEKSKTSSIVKAPLTHPEIVSRLNSLASPNSKNPEKAVTKWQANADAISNYAMQMQSVLHSTLPSPFCRATGKKSFTPRRAFDLKTKVQIIRDVEKGEVAKKDIAKKYNIALSTLTCIMKKKAQIIDNFQVLPEYRKRLKFKKSKTASDPVADENECEDNPVQECPSQREADVRKRRSIDLFTKMAILQEVDRKQLNKKAIACKFSIPASTLTTIINDRDRIQLNSKFQSFTRKKFKRSRHTIVEFRLLAYLSEFTSAGIQLSTTQLCDQAKLIAQQLGIENFKCEPGSSWIWRFKQRFNLVGMRSSDDKMTDEIEKWHRLNDPGRPNNQKLVCDLCGCLCIGRDKMERHVIKKHFL